MPIIVVGREKNFDELRARLFKGRVSAKVVRDAAAAIEDANPHADLENLRPGTVLSVPEAPGISLRRAVALDDSAKETIEEMAGSAKEALGALIEAGAAREKAAAAERKNLAAALGSDEVERAAKKDDKLAADVAAVRKAIEEDEGGAKERTARLKKAQAEWSAGLDALMRLGE